jgi:hypothetical protein
MNANPATIVGGFTVAMVLSGSSGLAQTAKPLNQDAAQQTAPPSSEAPGAGKVGNEQAAPSSLPAMEATTNAVTKEKIPATVAVNVVPYIVSSEHILERR